MGGLQDLISTMNYLDTKSERDRQEAFNIESEAHLEAFNEMGTDYVPEGEYDSRAYAAAETGYYNSLLQKDENKRIAYEARKRDIEASHMNVMEYANKAYGIEALITETTNPKERYGLESKALKYYEQAYEAFADGTDMEVDDKTLIFTDMDGTQHTKTYGSRKEMLENMKKMVEQVSSKEAFAKMAMSSRNDIAMHNAKQWSEPITLRNKSGQLARMTVNLRDPNTGQLSNKNFGGDRQAVNGIVIRGPNGEMLSIEEAQDQGYVSLNDGKTIAQIEKAEAETRAAKQRGKAAKLSPEKILANDLAETYNVDPQVAMDKVLKMKQEGKDVTALYALIKDNMGEIDEDIRAVMKDMGMENYFKRGPAGKELKSKQQLKDEEKKLARAVASGGGVPKVKGSKPKPTKEMKSEFQGLVKSKGRKAAINMMKEKYPGVF